MTLTRPLRRSDGILDPDLPAELLERQVRAHLPWPGSFIEVDGDRLVVLEASVAPGDGDDEPGRLVPDRLGLPPAPPDRPPLPHEGAPRRGPPQSRPALL